MAGRTLRSEAGAWALLGTLKELQVAGCIAGRPRLAAMHTIVHDGWVWLHGAPGIGLSGLEGTPVAMAGAFIVARIPSHFRDPVRACPATTFYRSVRLEGTLEAVDDLDARAAALQAMMRTQQPEGGHAPVDATDPRYTAALRGLGMWRVRPETLTAVDKLGQHLPEAEVARIVAGLWRRGRPGDLAAIEAITDAHPERPRFASVPAGLVPRCSPSDDDVTAAVTLVADRYWNVDQTPAALAGAVRHSAWVGLEKDGILVATARAISDRHKRSWIYDVAVADGLQGQGIGCVLMTLLLDHPAVRDTEVSLGTRDAMAFYERFGFAVATVDRRGAYPRHGMVRPRASSPQSLAPTTAMKTS